jgi:hypothetical protein
MNSAHANMDLKNSSLVEPVPKPWPTPPTHFMTYKFTDGYQEFVNTYGIQKSREANPALSTVVTFPFFYLESCTVISAIVHPYSLRIYFFYETNKQTRANLCIVVLTI